MYHRALLQVEFKKPIFWTILHFFKHKPFMLSHRIIPVKRYDKRLLPFISSMQLRQKSTKVTAQK